MEDFRRILLSIPCFKDVPQRELAWELDVVPSPFSTGGRLACSFEQIVW